MHGNINVKFIMTVFICALIIGQEVLTSKFHAVEKKVV
jgi:K+-transporting ATPase A subunit